MLDLKKFYGQKLHCAGLGEVLFDVFKEGPKIGGAPANFAYHANKLGLESCVISAVGEDELGELAIKLLKEKGLKLEIQKVNKPTGYVQVVVDAQGMPTYKFADDTAYDNLQANEQFLALASKIQVCCFGSLAQRNKVSQESILKFLQHMPQDLRLRVFDVNLRSNFFNEKTIFESLIECEIFKCNDEELPVLMKLLDVSGSTELDFYRYLNTLGIYGFIYTCGAQSSSVFINDEYSTLPTPKVQALSTVGAGDSFTATIIALLLKGKDLKTAHKLACEVSAFVCTKEGAMPEYPLSLKEKLL